ncbi:sialomucin core protein 24-like isoform X2 [Scleropages formosus]|uniref:sialomucin core protein 24-like isoform X2 n=1 Tax=Scleropages formosus TaxID=113540 RepID=UPI000879189D|nr:sialomucin core protein 24-like isoform X2 [Scleropages formosus]
MEVTTCGLALCVLRVLCVLSGAPTVTGGAGQSTNVPRTTIRISPQFEAASTVAMSPSTPLLRASTRPGQTTLNQSSSDPSWTTSLYSNSSRTTPLLSVPEGNSSRSNDTLTVAPYSTRQPAHLNNTAAMDTTRSFPQLINSTHKDIKHPTLDDSSTPTPFTHKSTGGTDSSLSPTHPNTPSTTATPAYESTAISQLIFTSSPAETHEEGPSVLNVGDDVLLHPRAPLDPLLAALLSVFIVMGAIVSLFLFLKFRQHSERPEFHRLQDLPMDDMMEDTPLSRYSY